MTVAAPASKATCAGCGTEVAATFLSCPVCHRLVHGGTLKALASQAEAATRNGELREALIAWRSSLDLLPAGSRQHAAISQRVEELSKQVEAAGDAPAPPVPQTGAWKWLAALGPIGLLLWKFKFLVVAILTKGKLLLFGLTKASTLLSMFAAVGVYWAVWGLWFAVGLVVSIYIHEMGHVAALRRYGIAASAPMFIPGFGALVRLKQNPVGPREDARIGLAGPIWGLGAALAAWAIAVLGGGPMYNAIAHVAAWLNLFNLMPIWPLDGGRAFTSLIRPHRWIATAAVAIAYAITGDGIVLLVLIVAAGRSFTPTDDVNADFGTLATFVALALALATVMHYTPSNLQRIRQSAANQSFLACNLRCDAFSR